MMVRYVQVLSYCIYQGLLDCMLSILQDNVRNSAASPLPSAHWLCIAKVPRVLLVALSSIIGESYKRPSAAAPTASTTSQTTELLPVLPRL